MVPRNSAVLIATLALCALALDQANTSTQASAQTAAPPGATVLQTGTQLVVVDVVVEDKDGHPVRGLKASNFKLSEDKDSVALHSFDEHTPATAPSQLPALPQLPAGTFTDYTPIPPSGTLNVLLLDALNTPIKDQSYVRAQLADYVKHAPVGTHIAIFGLNTRLFFLQGFTSDPTILQKAVDKKLLPRSSNLLDDPTGNGSGETVSDSLADLGAPTEILNNLIQFEAETAAFQTQLRIQYTLDAFNTLGHYLSAFPGRKNLIWFSGSFPINVLPDPTLPNAFGVSQINDAQFRETMNLLTQAQVAVYPIDARGLMTAPMFSASNSGSGYARNPSKFSSDLAKFNQSQATEHDTMQQMADDTGGQAFYNTNGITAAISKAIDAGSSYYTLTYSPPSRNYDGSYRKIRVELVDAPANLKLSYRRGYFADDPEHLRKNQVAASVSADSVGSASAAHHTSNYVRASMSRGAPAPQDILFKVRVVPASAGTEPTPVKGNQLDPHDPMKGPFQALAVDFVSLPSEVSLLHRADGTRDGVLEYVAYLFDNDGKLLNTEARSIDLHLTPENYVKFLHSALQMHLEISAPLRPATYLRLGLHDAVSNHIGVLEIPVASVSHLPPLPSTPSTPTPSSPAPSTPSAPPAPSTTPTPSTPH